MTQPDAPSTSQIDDLENRHYRAMVDGDTGALDELLSDDVVSRPHPGVAELSLQHCDLVAQCRDLDVLSRLLIGIRRSRANVLVFVQVCRKSLNRPAILSNTGRSLGVGPKQTISSKPIVR